MKVYFETCLMETKQDRVNLSLSIFAAKTTHHVFEALCCRQFIFFYLEMVEGYTVCVVSVRGKSLDICFSQVWSFNMQSTNKGEGR